MKKKEKTLAEKILELLNEPKTEGELTRVLHINREAVREAIEALKKEGYPISEDEISSRFFKELKPRTDFKTIPKERLYGSVKKLKQIKISDTHYAGLQNQPHLIPFIIKVGDEEGVDGYVLVGDIHNGLKHGGNIVDTIRGQIKVAFRVLIALNKTTYITPGDHDLWQWSATGADMVQDLVGQLNNELEKRGRQSLFHYIGEATDYRFKENGFVIELLHLSKGKSRGLSYSPQIIFEDRFGEFIKAARGETNSGQPDEINYGNWHVEIEFFQAGTIHRLVPGLQGPTSQTGGWEHLKGLVHQYGFWLTEVSKNKDGDIVSFDSRYFDLTDMVEKHTVEELEDKLVEIALSFKPKKRRINNERQ